MVSAALLVGAAALLTLGYGRHRWVVPTLIAAVVAPLLAAVGWAAAAGAIAHRRLRAARRRREQARGETTLLAEMLSLGVSAGLSLPQALGLAGRYLGCDMHQETVQLASRARVDGLAAALTQARGDGSQLYRTIARSLVSGAPLQQTLQAFVTDRHREQRARELEQAKRLPLRLMVPVALLILPGFVLLSLGPTIVGGLERLVIP